MSELVGVLIAVGFLAFIPALIAQRRGHSAVVWWLLGLVVSPLLATPFALLLRRKPGRGERRCPHCHGVMPYQAGVCHLCTRPSSPPPFAPADDRLGWMTVALAASCVLLAVLSVGLILGTA